MKRRGVLAILAGLFGTLFGRSSHAQTAPAPTPGAADPQLAAMRARMIAALPYPHIATTGEKALAEWERLRAEGRGWPVIVGDDEQLEAIAEQFSLYDPTVFPVPKNTGFNYPPLRSPADILAAAAKVKLPQDLAALLGLERDQLDAPSMTEMAKHWPEPGVSRGAGLTVASDVLSGRPFAAVHILLLPTQDSAEAPAYLRWGGWNACPPPEIHVAVLRDWKRRYGTELIGLNRDTMNLLARSRPGTKTEALALAHEQFLYCSDLIEKGVGTHAALAAVLMENDWWYFWWD